VSRPLIGIVQLMYPPNWPKGRVEYLVALEPNVGLCTAGLHPHPAWVLDLGAGLPMVGLFFRR